MANELIGYAYLANLPAVQAQEVEVECRVTSVKKKEIIGGVIAIPRALMPSPVDSVLGHILFALKHEGVNLQILAQALPLIPAEEMLSAFSASPNGKYIRVACYLWEHFTHTVLARDAEDIPGKYQPLFDPERYITCEGERNRRWKVLFNGLGSIDYCVTVRKTELIQAGISKQVLDGVRDFTEQLDPQMLHRALAWAYLSETKSSFEIEKEVPDDSKAHRFVNLLKKAHEKRLIDEDFLVDLQNQIISNKFDWASSFRLEQNYMSNGYGAAGVTYIPPPPDLCRTLMEQWMGFANQLPAGSVDPIITSAVISFGFVFIHPFMDGNGRISRFMYHHALCQQGRLDNGLILPVSAVLRDRELDYLNALTSFSEKTRRFWNVEWISADEVYCTFTGHDAIYRYWDGTACAELMFSASEEAVEQYMKKEVSYLQRYDQLKRRIDREFDVADKVLSALVMLCLDQKGRVSQKRRDQYQYQVPEDLFDAIEEAYRELFREKDSGEATADQPE
ncbi:cell filamentation protein Fic [Marinobacterium iners]|nr:cell filamentation protein Fic [Marinobacterium iners]